MKDLQNEIVIAGVMVVMMILTYASLGGASENEAAVIEFDNSSMPERIYDTETKEPRFKFASRIKVRIGSNVHIVAKGDTLFAISQRYKISVADLKRKNNLTTNALSVGQEIRLD